MVSKSNNKMLSIESYFEMVDSFLAIMSQDGRSRLANNIRRYFAPTTSLRVIESGQLEKLASERKTSHPVTVLFIDVRDFVKTIREMEMRPTGMQRSRDLLQQFFDITSNIVFSYEGMIGEFAGDRIMAVFGVPDEQIDHADRAVQSATEIERAISTRINSRGLTSQSILNVGIGIHTGRELYLSDVGSSWRRELVIIGSMVNVASRIEELNKSDEAQQVNGYNILVSNETLSNLKHQYDIRSIGKHKIRGYHDSRFARGDDSIEIFKVVDHIGVKKIEPASDYQSAREMVSEIAVYIESFEERNRASRYRAIIENISLLWTSSDSVEDTLSEVLRITCELLGARNATVWLKQLMNDEYFLVPTVIFPDNTEVLPKRIGEGLIGQVALQGRPMIVMDLNKQDQVIHNAEDDKRARLTLRSMLAVPIIANNVVIGAIQLLDSKPGNFSLSDEQTLASIAAETSLLLQKLSVEKEKHEVEFHAKQLGIFKSLNTRLLEHIRQSLISQESPDALLSAIMNGVVTTFNAQYATLYLVDWSKKELEFRVVIPQQSAENLPKRHSFADGGIAVHVAQSKQPILESDLLSMDEQDEVQRSDQYDESTMFRPRSMMCVPIEAQNRVNAVLQVMDNEPQKFNEVDLEVLQHIAATAGIALDNVTQYRRRTRAEQIAAMNLMAGNMVHHFNNEIGLIPPTLEFMDDVVKNWDLSQDQFEFLARNFAKLTVSARNALNYVKIIREPFESTPQPTRVIEAAKAGLEKANIPDTVEIEIHIDDDLPLVMASEELSIVFRDLLKNAVEAMTSSDSPLKHIEIHAKADIDVVKISVKDTGPGISSEKKDELFQSYGTVSTKGDGNMGFGLFLANFYVEVMGGRLFLDQEYTHGAHFIIELQVSEGK